MFDVFFGGLEKNIGKKWMQKWGRGQIEGLTWDLLLRYQVFVTWRSFDAAGKDRKDTSPCSLVPKMEVRNTDVSSMDTAMDTGIPHP